MRFFILLIFIPLLVFAQEKVLFHIDFKNIANSNDAVNIMKQKGFDFEMDEDKFHFFIKNERLYIETTKQATVLFGKLLEKKDWLKNPSYAVIKWGVEDFPQGSDWENGNNRLPIGLILVFGDKKLPSGIGFLAPKVPPFLCPFIGEKEKVGKPYLGKLYKKGGRYYCVSNEGDGKLITTKFNITKHYKQEFDATPPPLSAYAFQINTKDTDAKAKSFIESLTIYGD